ncbi:unnamed protein product [Prunus armeniaca]
MFCLCFNGGGSNDAGGSCWDVVLFFTLRRPQNYAWSYEAKNLSQLRKKPKTPSAEKTQVGYVPSSSAKVKHLVGADSRKVSGTRSARDVLLKPSADKFENHDLLCRIARARSISPAERKRDAYILLRSSVVFLSQRMEIEPRGLLMIQLLSHGQSSVELIHHR